MNELIKKKKKLFGTTKKKKKKINKNIMQTPHT